MMSGHLRSGYTLITVIFIVAILVVLATIGLGLTLTEVGVTKNQKGGAEALTAAETGVNRAIYFLENDVSGSTWKQDFEGLTDGATKELSWGETTLPDGQTYKVNVLAKRTGDKIRGTITSDGTSPASKGKAQRKLEVIVEARVTGGGGGGGAGRMLDFAVYSARDFIFNQGTGLRLDGSDLWSDRNISYRDSVGFEGTNISAHHVGVVDNTGANASSGITFVHELVPIDVESSIPPVGDDFRNYILSTMRAGPVTIPSFTATCIYDGQFGGAAPNNIYRVLNLQGGGGKVLPYPPPAGCTGNGDVSVTNVAMAGLKTLSLAGFVDLTVNGNMYIEGNLSLAGNVKLTVKGYLVVDGGINSVGGARINAYGVYAKGIVPSAMPSNPPGSWVGVGGFFARVYDVNRSAPGDIYLKGRLVLPNSITFSAGNVHVDANDQNVLSPAVQFASNVDVTLGNIYAPNGSVEFPFTVGVTIGDVRAGKNITLKSGTGGNFKGTLFAEGDIILDSGTDFRGDPSGVVNMYAGGKLVMKHGTALEFRGLLASVGDINGESGTGVRIQSPGLDLPSGLVTDGKILLDSVTDLNIEGVMWGRQGISARSITDVRIKGGVLSGEDVDFSEGTDLKILYDRSILDSSLPPFPGGGGGGTPGDLKVVNWRECLDGTCP